MTHDVAKLTERQIEHDLKTVAHGLAGHMVEHLLRRHVRDIRSTKVRPPGATRAELDTAERIYKEIEVETQALNRLAAGVLSSAKLRKTEVGLRRRVDKMLLTNGWKREFSGYRVIQELLAKYVHPFSIEQFRDELVAEMKADGFRPPAMEKVVMAILDD
jgi:hypothetical protein